MRVCLWPLFCVCCKTEHFFRPVLGEVLFFASPKKSTQKKGDPKAPVASATALRFSEQSARAELAIAQGAIAQAGGALSPITPAMLGGAYGNCGGIYVGRIQRRRRASGRGRSARAWKIFDVARSGARQHREIELLAQKDAHTKTRDNA